MERTNSEIENAGKKSFTRIFPHLARVLMGLAFLFFGVIGLLHLMKAPDNLPDDIKMVNGGLMKAGC